MLLLFEWCTLFLLGLCTLSDIGNKDDYTTNVACGICFLILLVIVRYQIKDESLLERLDNYFNDNYYPQQGYYANNNWDWQTQNKTHNASTTIYAYKNTVVKDIFTLMKVSNNIKNTDELLAKTPKVMIAETEKTSEKPTVEGNTITWGKNTTQQAFYTSTMVYKAIKQSVQQNAGRTFIEEIMSSIVDIEAKEHEAIVYFKNTERKTPKVYLTWSVIRNRASEILGDKSYIVHCKEIE